MQCRTDLLRPNEFVARAAAAAAAVGSVAGGSRNVRMAIVQRLPAEWFIYDCKLVQRSHL